MLQRNFYRKLLLFTQNAKVLISPADVFLYTVLEILVKLYIFVIYMLYSVYKQCFDSCIDNYNKWQ